jgi:hypothetical protein
VTSGVANHQIVQIGPAVWEPVFAINPDKDADHVRACLTQGGFPQSIKHGERTVYLYPLPAKPPRPKPKPLKDGPRSKLAPGQILRRGTVQAWMLSVVARSPSGMAIAEIDHTRALTPARKIIDLLMQKRLVQSIRIPCHGGPVRYHVTDKGRAQLKFVKEE